MAAIGGFLFGFDSGVINGAVDALANAFGTRAAATGFAVASVLLGCAVGAFVAGTIADIYGRRPTMLLNAVFFLASALATGAAGSAGFFIAARIAGGLAIGAASVLAPMYIAEVAPAHIRGRLASLQQMAIVLGLFSAFLSNDILARIAGGAGAIFWLGAPAWRWMFWMEAVPAAAFLLGVLFIPESPRFLIFRGKHERARRDLRSHWRRCRKTGAAGRAKPQGRTSPASVGSDYSRHETYRSGGLGGNGSGGFSAIRRYQHHLLLR